METEKFEKSTTHKAMCNKCKKEYFLDKKDEDSPSDTIHYCSYACYVRS